MSEKRSIIRPAAPHDVAPVAAIWHQGWIDGHRGHVPDDLERHRTRESFTPRTEARLARTTVASIGAEILGCVVVTDDEIEQLYVARHARGTGVAGRLLASGESMIAARFDRAWLAVAAGNARARRFYERCGWSDTGPFANPAEAGDGVLLVPSLRYEKDVQVTAAAAR